VQKGDRDRRFIEMHVGEDRSDLERMGNIGIAARALLLAMLLHGVDIGFVQQCFIGIGLVLLNPLHELVLPHHSKATPIKIKARQSTIGAHMGNNMPKQ
jgi:predicted ferric reductase